MKRERYIQLLNLCMDCNEKQERYRAEIECFNVSESIEIIDDETKDLFTYYTHHILDDHVTQMETIKYHWINDPSWDAAEARLRAIIEGVTE